MENIGRIVLDIKNKQIFAPLEGLMERRVEIGLWLIAGYQLIQLPVQTQVTRNIRDMVVWHEMVGMPWKM